MPSVAEHTQTGGRQRRRVGLPMEFVLAFGRSVGHYQTVQQSWGLDVESTECSPSSPLFIHAFQVVGILGLRPHMINVQHRGPRTGKLEPKSSSNPDYT